MRTHHRFIGFGYLTISVVAVIVGSILSLLMRLHLAWPAWSLPLHGPILPEEYLALVTMHGTLMLFFVMTVATAVRLREPHPSIADRRTRDGLPALEPSPA